MFVWSRTRANILLYALYSYLQNYSEENFLNILLYGAEKFTSWRNKEILKWTEDIDKIQIILVTF